LFKSVNLQILDTVVSFDVVSLFTNVPVDEALQDIRNKLHNDEILPEQYLLQVGAITGTAGILFDNRKCSGGR
jgi:hypothetical protein